MDFETLQVFGEKDENKPVNPNDIISCLQFSPTGTFLASGDFSGRVVIFRYNSRDSISFVTQINAHKSEFDYLRSELSEPRICAIRFIPKNTINPMFMTTNMHESKLWRLKNDPHPAWNECNLDVSLDSLVLPSLAKYSVKYEAELVKKFFSVDTEYIVSLETLHDQTSFAMIDVGCVKLWDIEREVSPVTIFSMPSQRTELTASAVSDVLTYGILVSDDQGVIRMLDLRQQSSNLSPSVTVSTMESLGDIKDGAQYVSSVKFMPDGYRFVARTFESLLVYDMRNVGKPIGKMEVQKFPSMMEGIIENGYNRDTFTTGVMADGSIVSGKYGNEYVVWNIDKEEKSSQLAGKTKVDVGDFMKRVSVIDAHPTESVCAVGSSASLYVQGRK